MKYCRITISSDHEPGTLTLTMPGCDLLAKLCWDEAREMLYLIRGNQVWDLKKVEYPVKEPA